MLLPRIHPLFVAMRIHELSATGAFAVCVDPGDQQRCPDLNIMTAAPDHLDDANALEAENPAGLKVAKSPWGCEGRRRILS
jgi:hypothetical protein